MSVLLVSITSGNQPVELSLPLFVEIPIRVSFSVNSSVGVIIFFSGTRVSNTTRITHVSGWAGLGTRVSYTLHATIRVSYRLRLTLCVYPNVLDLKKVVGVFDPMTTKITTPSTT